MKNLKRFCIIGRPLEHTKSPFIYNYLFNKFSYSAIYEQCELEALDKNIFQELIKKYDGFNVTSPYKEDVIKFLDYLSDEVKILNACNLVLVKDHKTYGYNTDYFGFYESFKRLNLDLNYNSKIFILGTGGCAKVCYNVLLSFGFSPKYVSRSKLSSTTISYNTLYSLNDIDLIINATPLGLDKISNPLIKPVKSRHAFDAIYNPPKTPFLNMFNSNYNGLPFFILQAIKTFNLLGFNDEVSYTELEKLLKEELHLE